MEFQAMLVVFGVGDADKVLVGIKFVAGLNRIALAIEFQPSGKRSDLQNFACPWIGLSFLVTQSCVSIGPRKFQRPSAPLCT